MKLIPSRLLVLLMLGPAGLAMLTLFDSALLTPLLAVDGGLVVLAAVDGLLGRAPRVDVTRQMRAVFSVGRNNPVSLTVRSRVGKSMVVQITDDVFTTASVEGLPARLTLGPRATATVRYQVRPHRRGAYQLGAHTVRYATPLGLWIRQQRIQAEDTVRVYPDVQAVRAYELLARRDRAGAMVGVSRRPGGENEFERLREYIRADEYRSIDWKATARRQKLIARQYQLERNQTLQIMLDAGRLMTVQTQGLPLFDHALNAALMLAHVSARGGDRVGAMVFSDRVLTSVAPTSGRAATRRLVQATYHLHPELCESDYEAAFARAGHVMRQRALVILFTQVYDDVSAEALARHVRGLSPRHLPLVVLLRDPEVESLARVKDDAPDSALYTAAAAAEILGWRDRLVLRLRHLGANVLDVEPRELTVALVGRYLEIKLRHLL